MKMKKLAALALSAVFALGALTACGGSSSSGSVPAAASASGSGSVSDSTLVGPGTVRFGSETELNRRPSLVSMINGNAARPSKPGWRPKGRNTA